MYILAFETSCDDTSIALFGDDRLIAMDTLSQVKIHNITNGVVPEVAAREHANNIFLVLENVLNMAQITLPQVDYIAVATHPGLLPSLLTGVTVAGTISLTLKIPIISINHIQSHVFSNFLERKESEIVFPLVCLTASGGHTEIYFMKDMFSFDKIGGTQDDAAGEAFDKVSKMMNLGYPGGPIISQLSDEWALKIQNTGTKIFPRVWLRRDVVEFSFSGLKTAVKREIEKRGGSEVLSDDDKKQIAYEFSQAILEVLAEKLVKSGEHLGAKTVSLAGGVSANENLRKLIQEKIGTKKIDIVFPQKKLYCMDNAAMIGITAYYKILYGRDEAIIGTLDV